MAAGHLLGELCAGLSRRAIRTGVWRPGEPVENDFIKSLNGTSWRAGLNMQWFVFLAAAEHQFDAWRRESHVSQPHRALHDRTPAEFADNYRGKERIEAVNPANKLALQMT